MNSPKFYALLIFILAVAMMGFIGCSKDSTSPTTPVNQPPLAPYSPSPVNGATNQALSLTLTWTGSDPDANDTLTYDVYMGTTNTNLPSIATGLTSSSRAVGPLSNGTTYYWRVVAMDMAGDTTGSDVWSFSTISNGTTTDNFIATEDGDISNTSPTTPHNATTLEVGIDAGAEWQSLMKFATGTIPANAVIDQATLSLYPDLAGTGAPFAVYIGWILQNWGEDTLTWSNQPDASFIASNSWVVPTTAGAYITFDVIDEIQAMRTAGVNDGLVMWPVDETTTNPHWKKFRSSEQSSNKPKLTVVYHLGSNLDSTVPAKHFDIRMKSKALH